MKEKIVYHLQCPICTSEILKDKYYVNNFTISKCIACQCVFVKEKLSTEELDVYYQLEIEGSSMDSVYGSEDNIKNNLSYYYEKLASLIRQRISGGKILDIGCNQGQFLDIMEGFDRHGVEISLIRGEIARHKYGNRVFIGPFENYPEPEILFDCITLQDVLDHTTDPKIVIEKCRRILKPGGLIVVKAHDISCLYAKIMGKNFYAIIPPAHLFYFNKQSINMLLSSFDFEVSYFKHLSQKITLSTVFLRLARTEKEDNLYYMIHKLLLGTKLGKIAIIKNLHDIFTVIAIKK